MVSCSTVSAAKSQASAQRPCTSPRTYSPPAPETTARRCARPASHFAALPRRFRRGCRRRRYMPPAPAAPEMTGAAPVRPARTRTAPQTNRRQARHPPAVRECRRSAQIPSRRRQAPAPASAVCGAARGGAFPAAGIPCSMQAGARPRCPAVLFSCACRSPPFTPPERGFSAFPYASGMSFAHTT